MQVFDESKLFALSLLFHQLQLLLEDVVESLQRPGIALDTFPNRLGLFLYWVISRQFLENSIEANRPVHSSLELVDDLGLGILLQFQKFSDP